MLEYFSCGSEERTFAMPKSKKVKESASEKALADHIKTLNNRYYETLGDVNALTAKNNQLERDVKSLSEENVHLRRSYTAVNDENQRLLQKLQQLRKTLGIVCTMNI